VEARIAQDCNYDPEKFHQHLATRSMQPLMASRSSLTA